MWVGLSTAPLKVGRQLLRARHAGKFFPRKTFHEAAQELPFTRLHEGLKSPDAIRPGLGQRVMDRFRSSGTPMDPGRRRILAGGLGGAVAGTAGVGDLLRKSPVDIADLDTNQLSEVLARRWGGDSPSLEFGSLTGHVDTPLRARSAGFGGMSTGEIQRPLLAPWNKEAVAEDLRIAEESLTGRGRGLKLDVFGGGADRRQLELEDLVRGPEDAAMNLGQHQAPLTEESLSGVLGRVSESMAPHLQEPARPWLWQDWKTEVSEGRKDLRRAVGLMGEDLVAKGSDVFSQPLVNHYNNLYRKSHSENLRIIAAGRDDPRIALGKLVGNVRKTGMPMEPNLAAKFIDDFKRQWLKDKGYGKGGKNMDKNRKLMFEDHLQGYFEDLTMGTIY